MAAGRLAQSLVLAGTSAAVIYVALQLASEPIDIAPGAIESAPLDLLDPDLVRSVEGAALVAPETLARPVFSRSRRPLLASAPAAEPVAPEPQAMQFTLAGVMISGDVRKALITTPDDPNGEWLSVGGEKGGGRVEKIEPDWVEITSAAGTVRVQLYVDNNPPL